MGSLEEFVYQSGCCLYKIYLFGRKATVGEEGIFLEVN